MKKSKKTVALIAAVLMTVTMFSSAIPAYAAKKSDTKTISCGGQGAICSIESENKYTASAITTSILKYDYIYSYVIGCEVDSKGDVVRYYGRPTSKEKSITSGKITINTLNKKNYFKNISSAHIVKKGTSENGTSL